MFIPENEIKNVKSNKTRKYINEVISCYYNSNYRSAIVTLYITVIYDCLNKLLTLRDLYGDSYAQRELTEIESMQKNPATQYSSIEKKIIEVINNTGLLNHIELEQIMQLKTARNNAAHPVLCNDYDLINPTKEQALAHIRNMFEAVFTKDVILSKKILESFRSDICDFKDRQPDLNGYDTYLKTKYYSRFNEVTKKYVFGELWKSALWFDNDEDCNKYRKLFIKTLVRFLDWDKELYKEYISETSQLYERIVFKTIEPINYYDDLNNYGCSALIIVLEHHHNLWNDIPEDVKVNINNLCQSDANICLYAEFPHKNELEYIERIVHCIIKNNIKKPCLSSSLVKIKYEKHKEKYGNIIRKRLVDYYDRNTDSKQYVDDFDYINEIYKKVIKRILDDFTEEDLLYLLNKVDRYNYKNADINSEFRSEVSKIIKERKYNIIESEHYLLI